MKATDNKHKPVIYQLISRLFRSDQRQPAFNGSYERNGSGKMSDLSVTALNELSAAGYTHIWCTGLVEHASVTAFPSIGIEGDDPVIVKGLAGSPYAIRDYYDVCPDLADDPSLRMQEFESLVDRIHKQDLKLIIDFIANHLGRNYHSDAKPVDVRDFGADDKTNVLFDPQNNFIYLPGTTFLSPVGTAYRYIESPAKVTGNDVYTSSPSRNDWYETVKLNFGVDPHPPHDCFFDPVPGTWLKLRDVIFFWCGKGVDGYRCDMAHMVPVEFWSWLIPQVKEIYPGVIFIGEIYEPAQYGLYFTSGCFDFLYDKTGLYDTLSSVIRGVSAADKISTCLTSTEKWSNMMLSFIENHDEVRVASPLFAGNAEMGLPATLVCAGSGSGPLLIYFGQETGEPALNQLGYGGGNGRTSIFDYGEVPELAKWINGGNFDGALLSPYQHSLRNRYALMVNLCSKQPAFHSGKFYDLQYCNRHHQSEGFDEQVHYAWLRFSSDQCMLCIVSFDRDRSFDVHIQLPPEALRLAGLAGSSRIMAEEKFADNYTSVKASTALSGDRLSGFVFTLPPMGCRILELSPRD